MNYLPCVLGLSDDSFQRSERLPQQSVSLPFAIRQTHFLFAVFVFRAGICQVTSLLKISSSQTEKCLITNPT